MVGMNKTQNKYTKARTIIELARDIAKGDEARELGTLRGCLMSLIGHDVSADNLIEALTNMANAKKGNG